MYICNIYTMAKVNKNIHCPDSLTKPFSQQSRCSIVWESCRSYLDRVLNCLNWVSSNLACVNSIE